MNIRNAIIASIGWVLAALTFNAGVYHFQGQQKALEFLTGYLIEIALSVDNIFVFLLIFKYFKSQPKEQAKILTWGVWGAQFMRAILIIIGIKFIMMFSWLLYVLGMFLVIMGLKMFIEKEKDVHMQENKILKFCKKYFPFLKEWVVILIIVEATDLLFALDSIPAIFAITKDPFIVWTSNIFAIIGLRAMYFALAAVMPMFTYLHYALGIILVFVGATMLLEHVIVINVVMKLLFILLTLIGAVALSLKKNRFFR